MWIADALGTAIWHASGSSWTINARGGDHGIGFVASPSRAPLVALGAVDEPTLPEAAEQFIRGDQWHINYPQGSGRYAIRLALQPIQTTADVLVLEMVVSIQTDLLDSHPKLDIVVECQSIDVIVPANVSGAADVARSETAPVLSATGHGFCCSVLLGPHDRPFTGNHSTESSLRLRLFGQFLEKGVIRRGRPWIVIDRSGGATPPEQLTRWWRQLCETPVPLT